MMILNYSKFAVKCDSYPSYTSIVIFFRFLQYKVFEVINGKECNIEQGKYRAFYRLGQAEID
jgi:hypothetical protein